MAELATIARPYAEALFKATGSAGAAQTQQWLEAFAEAAANADVLRVAQSPKVTRAQILQLFEGLVGNAQALPPLAGHFLATVIDNGRLSALPLVAAQYRALVNDQEGAADAVVYSAFPISEEEVEGLRPALEKRFGRALNLTVETDASLIGGVRVVVGDEEFDNSVKARLEQMKATLTA